MGLLFSVLTAPYAPRRLLTAVSKAVQQEARRQLSSPAAVRRRLEELDEAVAAGELSHSERARAQRDVIDGVIVQPDPWDGPAG